MIVVYIILAIIALIFLMFFIYNYKTSVFFNSIIKEYIILRESGNSRLESNKKIISKKLLGNYELKFSHYSIIILADFDIIDIIQFLYWLKKNYNLETQKIPKLSDNEFKTIKRFNLLNYELKRKDLLYLNSKPDLRNNSIEISDLFESLSKSLERSIYI